MTFPKQRLRRRQQQQLLKLLQQLLRLPQQPRLSQQPKWQLVLRWPRNHVPRLWPMIQLMGAVTNTWSTSTFWFHLVKQQTSACPLFNTELMSILETSTSTLPTWRVHCSALSPTKMVLAPKFSYYLMSIKKMQQIAVLPLTFSGHFSLPTQKRTWTGTRILVRHTMELLLSWLLKM